MGGVYQNIDEEVTLCIVHFTRCISQITDDWCIFRLISDEVYIYMYGTQEKFSLKSLSKMATEGSDYEMSILAYYQ